MPAQDGDDRRLALSTDAARRLLHIAVETDPTLPPGVIELRRDGETVWKARLLLADEVETLAAEIAEELDAAGLISIPVEKITDAVVEQLQRRTLRYGRLL